MNSTIAPAAYYRRGDFFMAKRKPIDRAPDIHPFHAPVDSTFDIINRYGTYNIQPTADTENLFPLIAPGLPRAWGEMKLEKGDLPRHGGMKGS